MVEAARTRRVRRKPTFAKTLSKLPFVLTMHEPLGASPGFLKVLEIRREHQCELGPCAHVRNMLGVPKIIARAAE